MKPSYPELPEMKEGESHRCDDYPFCDHGPDTCGENPVSLKRARKDARDAVLLEAISLREAHTKNYASFHKMFELVDAYNKANDEYQDARGGDA